MKTNKFQKFFISIFAIFAVLFLILPVLALAEPIPNTGGTIDEKKYFKESDVPVKDININREQTKGIDTRKIDTEYYKEQYKLPSGTSVDKKSYIKQDVACTEYNYPWCGGEKTDIAGLIKKFYNYALAAVGVAALGAIIFGGIKYTVSAGNPSGQSDAISWITGAVWGLVLLLGANLLLRTINPNLVNLKMVELKPVEVEAQKYSSVSRQEALRYWMESPASPFTNIPSATLAKIERQYSSSIKSVCQGETMLNCNNIIKAIIAVESSGNLQAENQAEKEKALGLMQILESNGGEKCSADDNKCIQNQIQKGANLLVNAYNKNKQDLSLALAEYNGGGAATKLSACCSTGRAYECPWDCGTTKSNSYNCDVTTALKSIDPVCRPNEKFLETRNYVKKICNTVGC